MAIDDSKPTEYNPKHESEWLPDWCPLRELPKKMQVCGKYPQEDKIVPSYKIGYNACIDELLKGEER